MHPDGGSSFVPAGVRAGVLESVTARTTDRRCSGDILRHNLSSRVSTFICAKDTIGVKRSAKPIKNQTFTLSSLLTTTTKQQSIKRKVTLFTFNDRIVSMQLCSSQEPGSCSSPGSLETAQRALRIVIQFQHFDCGANVFLCGQIS